MCLSDCLAEEYVDKDDMVAMIFVTCLFSYLIQIKDVIRELGLYFNYGLP